MGSKQAYGYSHQKARAALLADDPLCVHCEAEGADVIEVATVADHQPPLALHDHDEGTGCCEYVPSCSRHSYEQAGQVAQMVKRGGTIQEVAFDEPDPSPGPDDPMWDVPWLADLLTLPVDATWPRFMSAPHPEATGSYEAEFTEWCSTRFSVDLRWWQRLVAARILEHDAEGNLLHIEWLFSVARQLGKSVLLAHLMVWATENVRRFWNANDVMITSRTLMSAEGSMKEMMKWGEHADGWRASKVNGQRGLILTGEYECMIRSIDSAYGETCGLVLLDECWDITSTKVAEGIEPTILGAEGTIGYTTTAHRKATSLSLNLRQRAFATLDDPSDDEGLLLIEWSADRSLALDDEEGWRQASPHWNSFRRKLINRRLKAAKSGEVLDPDEPDPIKAFEAQYLNRFPITQTRRGPGEPLFETGAWAQCLVTSLLPTWQRVVAIEDNFGKGLAVAEAGMTASESMAVRGWQFDDRAEGWAHAKALEADTYLISATLGADPAVRELTNTHLRGGRELRGALSIIRSLVNAGAVTHDGGPELADQMLACRVRHGSSGMVVASNTRHDLVHCAAWAVHELHTQLGTAPAVH